VFVAGATLLPIFVCNGSEDIYDETEIAVDNGWTIIHGKVFDLNEFANEHTGGRSAIKDYIGADASQYFPRTPPADLPSYCLSHLLEEAVFDETNSLGLQDVTCGPISDNDQLLYGPTGACHMNVIGNEGLNEYLEDYYKGELALSEWDLPGADSWQWIVIEDVVYNVTSYIDNLRLGGFSLDHASNERAYLNEALHELVVNLRGQDASQRFRKVFTTKEDRKAVKL
jgi:hypothetical protein